MNAASQRIRRVTWVGLVANLALSGLKFLAGLYGRSQAVIADSIHSLTDVATDIAILIAAKHWTAPPDDHHPYGHGRIETVVTLLIGVSLAGVAIRIAYGGLASLQAAHTSAPGAVALFAALVSIACKEALYRWTVRQGRRIQSKAVVANAWHHRSDALSSVPVAVAVGVAMIFPRWAFLDHIGAVVVSVFIIKAAVDIGKDAVYELIDSAVSAEVMNAVKDVAADHSEVREVHAVRARRVGSGLHVDMHLLVDGAMSVSRGHQISEDVRDRLFNSSLNILDAVVHLEPFPQEARNRAER